MKKQFVSESENEEKDELDCMIKNYDFRETRVYERFLKMRSADEESYKKFLIDNILEWQALAVYSREQLESKSIVALQCIYDNIL